MGQSFHTCVTFGAPARPLDAIGLGNGDVAPSSAWGSMMYAEGRRTGVGIADCPSPMRLTSPLFEARCIRFDDGPFHLSWDSHGAAVGPSPARRVPKPFSLQTGFVRALIANGPIAPEPAFVHPRQDRHPPIHIVVDPHLGLSRQLECRLPDDQPAHERGDG